MVITLLGLLSTHCQLLLHQGWRRLLPCSLVRHRLKTQWINYSLEGRLFPIRTFSAAFFFFFAAFGLAEVFSSFCNINASIIGLHAPIGYPCVPCIINFKLLRFPILPESLHPQGSGLTCRGLRQRVGLWGKCTISECVLPEYNIQGFFKGKVTPVVAQFCAPVILWGPLGISNTVNLYWAT